jgi:hypothetical protein
MALKQRLGTRNEKRWERENPFLYTIPVVVVLNPFLYTIPVVVVLYSFLYTIPNVVSLRKGNHKGFAPTSLMLLNHNHQHL